MIENYNYNLIKYLLKLKSFFFMRWFRNVYKIYQLKKHIYYLKTIKITKTTLRYSGKKTQF